MHSDKSRPGFFGRVSDRLTQSRSFPAVAVVLDLVLGLGFMLELGIDILLVAACVVGLVFRALENWHPGLIEALQLFGVEHEEVIGEILQVITVLIFLIPIVQIILDVRAILADRKAANQDPGDEENLIAGEASRSRSFDTPFVQETASPAVPDNPSAEEAAFLAVLDDIPFGEEAASPAVPGDTPFAEEPACTTVSDGTPSTESPASLAVPDDAPSGEESAFPDAPDVPSVEETISSTVPGDTTL